MKRYYITLTTALLLAILMTSTVLGNQVQPDEVEETGISIQTTADTRAGSTSHTIISTASALPNSLIFGNQAIGATSAVQTATLQNTSAAPLTITNIAVSGHYTQTNDCPTAPNPLAVSAGCVFNVTFAPKPVGIITGALIITSDAISSPHTVVLTGTDINHQIFLPIVIKAPYEPAKGVSMPSAYTYCADLNTLGVGWYYRNSGTPAPDCPVPDRRFVPRLSNPNAVSTAVISTAISNAQASGWIIGFTEPNINYWAGYATPRDGAIAWRQIEDQALPAGIKLVSPSPSQHDPGGLGGAATDGYTWIWKMIDEYENEYGEKPHFDAMGWNYYENNPAKFQTFFNARRQEALARGYNVPFWILEYAGECWNTRNGYPTGNYEVMTQITPFLRDTSWIARHAWFTNRIRASDPWAPNWDSCSLINPNTGSRTSLGTLYAGY